MKTINNHTEYLDARYKLDIYESVASEYRKNNKTNCIPAEICAVFPYANEIDNDLRSAIEVWEFRIIPPKKYIVYISEKDNTATTWTGQKLGDVIFLNTFRSNMNDVRRSIRVTAINGLVYSGTFFRSAGDYARIYLPK